MLMLHVFQVQVTTTTAQTAPRAAGGGRRAFKYGLLISQLYNGDVASIDRRDEILLILYWLILKPRK